jgi:hypothetical protein
MKSPDTYLIDRAMKKHEGQPNEGMKRFRESAQAQLTETVIDAALFSRPSNDLYSRLARHGGWFAQIGLNLVQKQRAGGFGTHFIIAVTAADVIVLDRRMTLRGVNDTGKELARWKRSELQVTTTVSNWQRQVTITPPEGKVVECILAEHPLSKSFVDLLLDPAASHQAVG